MFAIIGSIFGFLFNGISAALVAAVEFLQWAVTALWAYAISVYNALIGLTGKVLEGFRRSWDFLRATYDDVLKPAWQAFWKIIDRVKAILHQVFDPVLKFLYTVREYILDFYRRFVRPVLDAIDAVRQVLRVLELLHVKFAAQLDAALGQLEALIDKPFRLVLEKLNEIVNVVNRVITADGLFQRLALIRSLQRDVQFALRVFTNSQLRALTGDEREAITRATVTQTVSELNDSLADYWRGTANDVGAVVDGLASDQGSIWQSNA